MTNTRWIELTSYHQNEFSELCPDIGSLLGDERADTRLPACGPEARAEVLAALRRWRDAAQALADSELDQNSELDRDVLVDHFEVIELASSAFDFWSQDPELLAPLMPSLWVQLQRPDLPPATRFERLATRLRRLPEYLEAARQHVRDPFRLWLASARAVCAAAPTFLDEIAVAAERSQVDGALLAEVRGACGNVQEALAGHGQWLAGVPPATQDVPEFDRDAFAELCRRRWLLYDPFELREQAEAVLNELDVERERLAARIDADSSWGVVVGRVCAEQPISFAAGLARYRSQIDAAMASINERGLIGIPEGAQLEVHAMPAALALHRPLPTLVTARLGASAPTSWLLVPQPGAEQSLAGLSPPEVVNAALREAFPGRHLQRSWSTLRTPALYDGIPIGVLVPAAGAWADDMVEGWAHYAAQMLQEEGYAHSDPVRLIQVDDRRRSAAQALVALDVACGVIDGAAARERLVGEVGLTPESARAVLCEITRVPGQGIGVLCGVDHLFELRRAAMVVWQEDFTLCRFHELVLAIGGLPLRYVAHRLAQERQDAARE